MSDEIATLQDQVRGTEGELLAIQAVLIEVFGVMLERGMIPRDALKEAFNRADSIAEGTALGAGQRAHPTHTAQFLGVIEYLRTQVLGD